MQKVDKLEQKMQYSLKCHKSMKFVMCAMRRSVNETARSVAENVFEKSYTETPKGKYQTPAKTKRSHEEINMMPNGDHGRDYRSVWAMNRAS